MPEAAATILDTILAHKRTEVDARKAAVPLADVKARLADCPPTRGFSNALRSTLRPVALIAEVKKASPSAGIIRADFDPVAVARIYEDNSAACLSMLTDEHFFQGHDDYLKAVKAAVAIPILRKDFTIDTYQIYEARMLGADAILLIVSALTADDIRTFQDTAVSIGLDVLVEVHDEEEMKVAIAAEAQLIGINSRDLRRFVTDLAVVERIAPMAPTGAILVAESGIKTPADVARVAAAGAKAILVGESLMRQSDIGVAVRELMS